MVKTKRPRAGTITAFFRPVIELSSGPAQSSCSLGSSNPPASPAPDTRKTTRPPAPPRPATYEQLHLDLGQKDAVVTRCPECGMEYSKAKLEDDALHAKYHRSVVQGVEWQGYKGEVEACQYQDGSRVIIVDADVCSVFVRKKANEILSIVNSELGSAEMDPEPGSMIFLLVSRAKRVTGCVVAQPVKKAFRVVPDATDTGTRIDGGCNATQTNGSVQCRSDQPVPASCGISRIWVLKSERRKGAGAKLLSTVCANFLFGCTLGPSDLAFTEPTLVGKALAQRFCGRDDFLVY
ncbi:ESCO1/2 acetyl-transferase-domain-containing protein [Geranomyces variabilis]|nr:ESCO1/2 acetyl-transferase-domain-containing protein [Geranomyces variabilis]